MDNPDSKTILIAATDPNIVYLLQRYAETSGFQTVHCGFGDNLTRLARQVSPILVILQVEPQKFEWQQSLIRLKADPVTEQIPIMAYSCIDEIVCHQVDGFASILQRSTLYSDFLTALKQAGVQTR